MHNKLGFNKGVAQLWASSRLIAETQSWPCFIHTSSNMWAYDICLNSHNLSSLRIVCRVSASESRIYLLHVACWVTNAHSRTHTHAHAHMPQAPHTVTVFVSTFKSCTCAGRCRCTCTRMILRVVMMARVMDSWDNFLFSKSLKDTWCITLQGGTDGTSPQSQVELSSLEPTGTNTPRGKKGAFYCQGVERQKQKLEANMLILCPLTTFHTQLHIRHCRQTHLGLWAHACTSKETIGSPDTDAHV